MHAVCTQSVTFTILITGEYMRTQKQQTRKKQTRHEKQNYEEIKHRREIEEETV